jgi:archaellum biogenesis ATPase FlaH
MKTCRTFFGLKTLIVGDVNTGKTSYTQLLLLECRGKKTMVVLDMAPEKVKNIGGKMQVLSDPEIHYFTTQIRPPRLSAENEEEAIKIANENAKSIERDLLSRAESIPADALIVNDVSLYLQMGNFKRLLQVMERFQTVILNGYYGEAFPDGKLTRRERENMEHLMNFCDQVIEAAGLEE